MNFPLFTTRKQKKNLMSKNSSPIIVVAGDPKSVFLELFFKCYKKFKRSPLILIANEKLIIEHLKVLKKKASIRILKNQNKINIKELDNKKINLINIPLNYKYFKKIKIKESNDYIKKSFKKALDLIKLDKKLHLINGPIEKKSFLGKKYLGITEYLGNNYGISNKVVMLIYNKKLAVSPLTTHIPLKKVHQNISKKKIVNHVEKIHKFYKKNLKKIPNIALTGLNPHCESYSNTNEEDRIIKPAISFLLKKKYKISGPISADTIFLKKNLKKFDVIIGMYHDQVLAPLKTIYEFDAINITLGLPFLRVSPDHGPNFEMFGKNISDETSLFRSIEFLENQ